MKNSLKKFMHHYDLSWYLNKKNIPNNELVLETITYFTTGPGARKFKPLDFLNLLLKQQDIVINNWGDEQQVIMGLESIPVDPLERHILLGFLLKWFGGYPITDSSDTDPNRRASKKAIEVAFLKFDGDTPEKEFCKADTEDRKDMMKLSLAFTTAMRNNFDVNVVLSSLESDKTENTTTYEDYDDLFEAAHKNGAVGPFENEVKAIEKTRYNFNFNVWLQETKNWNYGDSTHYKKLLTKELFIEFLQHEKEELRKSIAKQNAEKETWGVKPLSVPENFKQLAISPVTGPVFALFSSLVHQCGIIEMGFDESKGSYCKRVSDYFKININADKARQYFNSNMDIRITDRKLIKVIELILPMIPATEKQKIQAHINIKTTIIN